MKKLYTLVLVLITSHCFSQQINFKKDSIFVNNKCCFLYKQSGNRFYFSSMAANKIIEGGIQHAGNGRFITRYKFLTVNKTFSNDSINGRNALIFALLDNHVILPTGELNETELLSFIDHYNGKE